MKKDANTIDVVQIVPKRAVISIEGDTDLVLNKYSDRDTRFLTAEDRKQIKEKPNRWEDIITKIHWRDPLPNVNLYLEANEEMMNDLLKTNAPCISAFGLKKSFGQAVVRNEIDKYATKFDIAMNVVAPKGDNIPITFSEWFIDEKLMQPQKGAPITAIVNHFVGWKADIPISYVDHVFSLEQIVNIVNLAGFGLGIGSGRKSGYGRYHVVGLK